MECVARLDDGFGLLMCLTTRVMLAAEEADAAHDARDWLFVGADRVAGLVGVVVDSARETYGT